MKKEVLVIIPTLGKRVEMLSDCLESIFFQKYPVKVVLVFPEKNYGIVKNLCVRFPEIILEPQDSKVIEGVNKVIEGVNYALRKYSDSEYFTWISDDDLLMNNCLERGVIKLEKTPNAAGVFGAVEYIDQFGRKIGKWNPPFFAEKINLFIPSAIKQEGTIFRMSTVKKVGPLPTSIMYCGDIYLILKMSKFGKFKKVKGLSVAKFRIHNDSATTTHRYRGNLEAQEIQVGLGNIFIKLIVRTLGPLISILKRTVFRLISLKENFRASLLSIDRK